MTDPVVVTIEDVLDEVLDGVTVVSPGDSDDGEASVVRANVRFGIMTATGHRDLPMPLVDVVGADLPLWLDRMEQVRRSGRAITAQMVWRVAGQVMRVDVRMVPCPDGVTVSLAEADNDDGRRRRVQRIVHLLDIAPDLRLTVRGDGTIGAAGTFAVDQLGEVIGTPMVNLLHARSQRIWNDQVLGAVGAHGLWSGELVFEPISGYTIPTRVTIVRNKSLFEVLARDGRQLDSWSEHLDTALGTDADTGLVNRYALFDHVESALTRLRYGAGSLVAASVVVASQVLARSEAKALGSSLSEAVHTGVTVGRTGPHSFVVVSEDALDRAGLVELADRIHVRARRALGGADVSVGAVRAGTDDRADHVLARSDRAAALVGPAAGVFVADEA